MMRRFMLVGVCALFVMAGVACGDDSRGAGYDASASGRAEPGVTPVGGRSEAFSPPQRESVTVFDDRLDPRQIAVSLGQPVTLEVTNRSGSECVFSAGGYLRGLRVPPGESRSQSFTVSSPAGATPPATATAPMGCEGDERRQGSFIVEFRGVLPGSDSSGGGASRP